MARSTYIYIVAESDYDGDHIEAAFTVKHECVTWLKKHPRRTLSRDVIRVPDGAIGMFDHRQFKRWAEKEFLEENE